MKNIFLLCTFLFFIYSCEKDAGIGGNSSIEGRVMNVTTLINLDLTLANGDGIPVYDTIYSPEIEKDVYIIYSDNKEDVYDDDFKTDWAGRYNFESLRQGDYVIYTYVDSLDYEVPIFRHITIDDNNSTFNVEDFIMPLN